MTTLQNRPRDADFSGGFQNPAPEAARIFRHALDAMARPGRIETVSGIAPPAPLSSAAGAMLLTLADLETVVHLAPSHDIPAVRDWLVFHTSAPFGVAEKADFAVGTWNDLQPVTTYKAGTSEYPDQSATLIVEMDRLEADGARLTGPGIKDEAWLTLPENDAFVWNRRRFPLGFDCFFTCGDRLAALPRSTRIGGDS
ncbi:phosphonate C-P lyase system protein PhnH [Aestuariibius sp. 2305UL40-4]|uniref:phosphonate C-P lyase system protein PhnH n=1 Tax=Aestuariibius violaceus TaxID=3234132 RepID=UPI00345F0D8D